MALKLRLQLNSSSNSTLVKSPSKIVQMLAQKGYPAVTSISQTFFSAPLWTTVAFKANSSNLRTPFRRYMNTTSATTPEKLSTSKAEGDISSVFSSLTGGKLEPLPQRFAELKKGLIAGNEEAVQAAWDGLLPRLKREIDSIHSMGPRAVPSIDFKDIKKPGEDFTKAMKKHGVAVVRGVVAPEVALQWKQDIRDYIKANPQTKGMQCSNNEPGRHISTQRLTSISISR